MKLSQENTKTPGQKITESILQLRNILSPAEFENILDLLNESLDNAMQRKRDLTRPTAKNLLASAKDIISLQRMRTTGPLKEVANKWTEDYKIWKEASDRGEEDRQTGRTTRMLFNAYRHIKDKPVGYQSVVIILSNMTQCRFAQELLAKQFGTILSPSICTILSLTDVAGIGKFNWETLEFNAGIHVGKRVFVDHHAIEIKFGPMLKALNA